VSDEKSTGAALWERVSAILKERGTSERAFAAAVLGNPTAIGRARASGSIPSADRAIEIAKALGVTVEWLVLGQGPSTAGGESVEGEVIPDPSFDVVVATQEVTLLGFLADIDRLGLARWAARAPREQTPTLAEAAKAIRILEVAPNYSNSSGVPIDGWGAFFSDLRANGFSLPKGSAKVASTKAAKEAIGDPLGGHETLGPASPRTGARRVATRTK